MSTLLVDEIMHHSWPSEAGRLGRLEPPHFLLEWLYGHAHCFLSHTVTGSRLITNLDLPSAAIAQIPPLATMEWGVVCQLGGVVTNFFVRAHAHIYSSLPTFQTLPTALPLVQETPVPQWWDSFLYSYLCTRMFCSKPEGHS